MFAVWITGIILSILAFLLFKKSKVQVKNRINYCHSWSAFPWVDISESFKMYRIYYFLLILLGIIPILNMICSIVFIVYYIVQYYSYESGTQGYKIKVYRI